MFGRLHVHHLELITALTVSGFTLERGGSSVASHGLAGLTTALIASGFTSERGGSSIVGRGLGADHD